MADVKIVVDAMGGDNAPGVVLDGTAQALAADPELTVVLAGPQEVVEPFAREHERVIAQVTTEVIGMGEHPVNAVRHKKDSSIVVGCRLVRDGEAQGFFSAGSTGACMAAATLVIRQIKGVKRPALASVMPTGVGKHTIFTDLGANADCRPEYLVQFARMGQIYSHLVLGIQNPTVGLLNIGSEDTKGNKFAQECFGLMQENVPNFQGNVEGNDLFSGKVDVIVTDGFTGNVALKTIEGTAKTLLKAVKAEIMSSTRAKIGGALVKPALGKVANMLSSDDYGGAQLLGVKGVCLIGHGSSTATAIASGIAATAQAVRMDMPARIAEAIQEINGEEARS